MNNNESPLDLMLKHHKPYCAYFIFSGDRHCSCGRDDALKELELLRMGVGSVRVFKVRQTRRVTPKQQELFS